METKSRYEVISDLETRKRDLIRERDSLGDMLIDKEKQLKLVERQKSDTILVIDRQIEDKKEDITNFKKSMAAREGTLNELIKSIDESLTRLGKMNQPTKL